MNKPKKSVGFTESDSGKAKIVDQMMLIFDALPASKQIAFRDSLVRRRQLREAQS